MRNLEEYPITMDEIVKCLIETAKAYEAEERIGDMKPILLTKAAEIIMKVSESYEIP